MRLDPQTFTCREHDVDLTDQVTDILDDDPAPKAYDRVPLLGGAARPRPFEVTVTCPGAGGSGAHDLVCAGTFSR